MATTKSATLASSPEEVKALKTKLRNARRKIKKLRAMPHDKAAKNAPVAIDAQRRTRNAINFPPLTRKILASLRDELTDVLAA